MVAIPPDVREALDEIKAVIHTKYGGKLPKIQDDPDLYRRLFGVIEAAEAMGVKIPLREVAKHLEVAYATLLARRKEYEKLREDGVIDALVGEKPLLEAKSGGEEGEERGGGEEPEGKGEGEEGVSDVTKSTEIVISSQVRKHLARRVEELARDEVKELIVLGGFVMQNVKPWCIREGYEDVRECIMDVLSRLEELEARVAELDAKYQACKRLASRLMRLAGDKMILIEEIRSAIMEAPGLDPEERQRLLDAVSEAILRLVENA